MKIYALNLKNSCTIHVINLSAIQQIPNGVKIPSAMDKAQFRRSLDSAASMVFRSGLPLTSSPAPVRKGTCFDFDSSLNSVQAIRR
jgi:hypothetical protein